MEILRKTSLLHFTLTVNNIPNGDYPVYLEPTEAMEHHQLTTIHVWLVCVNKNKHVLL